MMRLRRTNSPNPIPIKVTKAAKLQIPHELSAGVVMGVGPHDAVIVTVPDPESK